MPGFSFFFGSRMYSSPSAKQEGIAVGALSQTNHAEDKAPAGGLGLCDHLEAQPGGPPGCLLNICLDFKGNGRLVTSSGAPPLPMRIFLLPGGERGWWREKK